VSALSLEEIKKIKELDPVLEPSHNKKIAVRKSAKVGFNLMNKMLLKDLVRGAILTANLWDEAYVRAGKPDLSKYKSYRYPYNVDFIAPDYIDAPKTESANH